jgi:phosphate-selective porin OprO/OprP
VQFENERNRKIRIGNQKEAIGFEHLVSSRFLPFMERSFNQDSFYGGVYNGFNPGIQVTRNWGSEDMGVLQYGVFRPVNSVFSINTGDGDYSLVARITRLLQYGDEGRCLTHVGFSVRQATAVSQTGFIHSARGMPFEQGSHKIGR